MAQEKPLDFIASFTRQKCKLVLGFDAFRGHRQRKPPREPIDSANDSLGLSVMFQIRNKEPIDFYFIESRIQLPSA